MELTSGIVKLSTEDQNARYWPTNVRSLLTSFEHQKQKDKNPLGSNTPALSVVVLPISTTIMLFPDPSSLEGRSARHDTKDEGKERCGLRMTTENCYLRDHVHTSRSNLI